MIQIKINSIFLRQILDTFEIWLLVLVARMVLYRMALRLCSEWEGSGSHPWTSMLEGHETKTISTMKCLLTCVLTVTLLY